MAALITFALLIAISAVLALVWWFVNPPNPPTTDYTASIPTWNFSYREFNESTPFNRDALTAENQTNDWRLQMQACGSALIHSHVKEVILVHGTFVGDDPTGILSTIKHLYPSIEKHLASRIRRVLKQSTDSLFQDNGNYTQEYTALMESGLRVPCKRFTWTSENHHLGRLIAATKLAETIATRINADRLTGSDRVLLLGHSHAGQVFALLAQLLEYEQFGYRLLEVLQDARIDIIKLNAHLNTIRLISLDFTTFGTPVVYAWPDSGYYRLLHISNHRGTNHLAGGLKGILRTRDGDYIQQLGILGTDALAATPKERRLNQKLDEIFGPGRDLKKWRENIGKKMRVSPHGKTFLVNYKDDSPRMPNFTTSFFGHGIYTRYETMLFNMRLITEYFYKHNPR